MNAVARTCLRVWLKVPHNGVFCDVLVPAGVELQHILSNWKIDGYIVGNADGQNGAPFVVPWDSWSFAAFLVAANTPIPWTGKPN